MTTTNAFRIERLESRARLQASDVLELFEAVRVLNRKVENIYDEQQTSSFYEEEKRYEEKTGP